MAAIDFAALAAALLQRSHQLVPQWLPGGRMRGREWVCGSLAGDAGESCSVNLDSGRWADFAGNERGGDLVSLYAAIHGLSDAQAARELMQQLGWDAGPQGAHRVARELPTPAPAVRARSAWQVVVPVPDHAPPCGFRWGFKDAHSGQWVELEAVRVWEYAFEGTRYGYVARFERTDSHGQRVKETIPFTWCEDTGDARRTQRWHCKTWPQPRPLYVPARRLSDGRPVVLVEGEKCAEAGHELLGDEFDWVTWPGGAKSWALASWHWLAGREVVLWPDADAKRQRLTAAERAIGVDAASKPLLPLAEQPGMKAMAGIGAVLATQHRCTVRIVELPQPGVWPDGWDVADAIADGWNAQRVREFVQCARPFVPPPQAASLADAARGGLLPPPQAGAGTVPARGGTPSWRDHLLLTHSHAVKPVRENVVLALDGVPDMDVAGVPEVAGVLAWNELTNDVVKLRPTPWRTPAGAWAEVDDLLMGEWLVREHGLPSVPRGTLEEAVRMVAYRHRFHPVRQWLETLRWDGTPRLAWWLRRACLEEDEWDDRDPLQRYLSRVGTWFLQAMCARVVTPGVKFDYMLILEGQQGMRKSTLLRTLAGEWFADTGLVLGDKDSYQQLQGVWLYEIPELDAFSKADVMRIKAYVASQEDYFRASFDRRAAKYPRQVVFAGTTNEDHYLTDPTGNRRFWPVRVTRRIDIDWVLSVRDQLFAEAMERVRAGKRMHPLPDEELELFAPQQQARAVENAIETAICRYLYPPANASGPASDGALVNETTLVQLLGKIGIGIEKLGPGRFHEKQAAAALRKLGWIEARSSAPGRPRVYRRPAPQRSDVPGGSGTLDNGRTRGQMDERADSDCPF